MAYGNTEKSNTRQKILIVDDSEMNRAILSDMLGDDFDIMEVSDGVEALLAIKEYGLEISLILLDIIMPNMDGFEVLAEMNRQKWIEDIPVIIISSENNASCIERGYDLGATDYISRPFDANIVKKRALNTLMLYAKQKKLVELVADQIYEKEKNNNLMISILSHIVEFRNGESGLHVLHINTITDILLNRLMQKTDKYQLSREEISLIVVASSLHDIGKIAIDEKILNKPGRLTDEEFAIMKTHSSVGAQMLDSITYYQDERLLQISRDICRWHHERYDGRGYPDGLKGEEIPISAQVVSIADVYDALTSERVYKKAFSHEKAMEMIINGECGAFNPILIECLKDEAATIQRELKVNSTSEKTRSDILAMTEEMLQHNELSASERTLNLLERERSRHAFFISKSNEIFFDYTIQPSLLKLSPYGSEKLGLEESIQNPFENEQCLKVFGEDFKEIVNDAISRSANENPVASKPTKVIIDGQAISCKLIISVNWSKDNEPIDLFGKVSKIE